MCVFPLSACILAMHIRGHSQCICETLLVSTQMQVSELGEIFLCSAETTLYTCVV